MKKYYYIFLMDFKNAYVYKLSLFLISLSRYFEFILYTFLWIAIFGGKEYINNMTLEDTITYYLLVQMITVFYSNVTTKQISESIRTGKIANHLILNIDLLWMYFAKNIASIVIKIFMIIPVISFIYLFFDVFYVQTDLVFLLFGYSLILCLFINFFFLFIFDSMAFWLVEIGSIKYAFMFFIQFIAGKMIPYQFMPDGAVKIFEKLPFASMYSTPITIYLGKMDYEKIIQILFIQTIWVFILYFLAVYILNKGIKKIELVGG